MLPTGLRLRRVLSCHEASDLLDDRIDGPSLSPNGCNTSGFLDTQICGR
jgi:hypothetical protein